jgi:hypothetical protein
MILIVSNQEDTHARAVMEHLQTQDAPFLLFDTATYPRQSKLSIEQQPGSPTGLGLTIDGIHHDLSTVNAVWWRRPQPFELDKAITLPDDQAFAYGECHAAINGLWRCLQASWLNDPEKDEIASRKAYQLQVASRLGLTVPRTLITNDPVRARAFIDQEGSKGTIYKAFSATEKAWRETRLLKQDEIPKLVDVQWAPLIFQEYIRADLDLRITIVEEEVFAAAIHTDKSGYAFDYRMDLNNANIKKHHLPPAITSKLIALMKTLGLKYGAIDMRYKPNGEYVFLEINPAGQWLFIEMHTGQPITAALAHTLVAMDRQHNQEAALQEATY